MLHFDPYYFLFLIPPTLLSFWASMRVRSAFRRYSQVPTEKGYTGAQAAQILLDRAGIHDVAIVPARGMLTDHYNPATKQLALSEGVYSSRSVAAVGVATHEAGHAIQHATGYAALGLRSTLVPTVGIGSNLGMWVILIGFFMQSAGMIVVGCVLFSAVVLFQLVTLPVEFDASNRAKQLVVESGIIYPEEREGIDAVLNAAAWTYVAAAITSIATLAYYLFRASTMSRDE